MQQLNKAEESHEKYVQECKAKNVFILKSLIRIFGKFERLLYAQDKVGTTDTTKRDLLLESQRKSIFSIVNPQRKEDSSAGLQLRLNDVKQSLQKSKTILEQVRETDPPTA